MIMPRFSKSHDCPSSGVLRAHGAGALSPLVRAGVGAHLSSCDFCGAESQLLARALKAGSPKSPPRRLSKTCAPREV
jgi:hypothetical protein